MELFLFILLGFAIIGFFGYAVSLYNGLVRLRHNIDKSWGNIDVLLKQRRDELPKLVETCKGYMKHERELFEKVAKARSAYFDAKSIDAKTDAENTISHALKSIFALSENYPELKANTNFVQLQTRISGLENSIADRREFFNETVNLYNISIHQFPAVLVAGSLGYKKHHLLEIPKAEAKDVDINFN